MLKTGEGISFAVNKDDFEKKSWPNDGMRRSFSIYYHLVISFIEIGDITNHLFEQVISPRSEEYGGFGKTETVSDYKNSFTMSNVYDGVLSLFIMTSVTFSLYTHCSSIFVWYTEDLYSITILCRDHGGCFKENLNAPPAGIGLSALKSRQRQETCEHSHMHPQATAPYSQFGSIYTKSSYIYIWQQTISRITILQKRFIDCTLKENKSNKLLNKLILHF